MQLAIVGGNLDNSTGCCYCCLVCIMDCNTGHAAFQLHHASFDNSQAKYNLGIKPANSYVMTSSIWYRCRVATLVYGCPKPGKVAGVGLGRVIAVCGMLLEIRLAAGDQVRATSLPIPALAT